MKNREQKTNKITVPNIGLAIWRLKCFYETFVQDSTVGILLNFCAKNSPHRQAENRWRQFNSSIMHMQKMEESTARLEKFVLANLREKIGKILENYKYHDICPSNELRTDDNGIDIIPSQLELKFESDPPIYFSWANVEGWMTYSLIVSEDSFCHAPEIFTIKNKYWDKLIGKMLISFQVYGHKESIWTSTEMKFIKTTQDIYLNEPHLIVLEFESSTFLGVANFYCETDFIPKLTIGDDIWIFFDLTTIKKYIEILQLDKL